MSKNGFTLIEIIVAIAVIIILVILLMPNIHPTYSKPNEMKTVVLIDNLGFALDQFKENLEPGAFYPEASAEQNGMGTSILVKKLRDTFQFLDDQITESEPYQLVDGWGNPMRYKPWFNLPESEKINAHNKNSYDLWSAGEDGDFETEEDNVTNWKTNPALEDN